MCVSDWFSISIHNQSGDICLATFFSDEHLIPRHRQWARFAVTILWVYIFSKANYVMKCSHYFFNLYSGHVILAFSFKNPSAAGSKLLSANSIFPLESGTLNTWATSPANANKQSEIFLTGQPKYSPLPLPGKHRRAPSLIQSEKISGEMFRRVPCDFQLRMCGSSLCLDQRCCCGNGGGGFGFFREIAARLWLPRGKE